MVRQPIHYALHSLVSKLCHPTVVAAVASTFLSVWLGQLFEGEGSKPDYFTASFSVMLNVAMQVIQVVSEAQSEATRSSLESSGQAACVWRQGSSINGTEDRNHDGLNSYKTMDRLD